ncbi:hypothetical protein SBI_07107 [Streptomyces bingchenggensis BCW-1]|uniref:Transposase n=4 Tax=Streptomyces TaxID=1883 RepID=D7C3K2_STRBB|nr:hypothetical protein SBI_07107 [Streptomyces bingchenggensis BCW-1]
MYPGRREVPLAVRVRDQLGELFGDVQFAVGFGVRGRPGWSPGRLALVTVFQMAENLTDRQAAEQVRLRLDWKYALGLGLGEPGFDASVLCEFRARVIEHGLEEKVLDLLLAAVREKGLVMAGGRQRTDSTHVLAAVRDLNRLELAGESVRAAVESLSTTAPEWLAAVIDVPGWSGRYGRRIDSWRLPSSATRRAALAVDYGRDAFALLGAVHHPSAPPWLRELEAVQVLRMVVLQNYTRTVTTGSGREVVKRREADKDGLPPGRVRLTSPYDTDARFSRKDHGGLGWMGCKLHISETCTPTGPSAGPEGGNGGPNLITNVATTDATVTDVEMTEPVHQALHRRGLLPGEHYLDSGYSSAELVAGARAAWGITLITPLRENTSAQARARAGYAAEDFTINYDQQHALCPQGHTSRHWSATRQRNTQAIVIQFATDTCGPCPVRDHCTTSQRRGRQLTVRPREVHEILRTTLPLLGRRNHGTSFGASHRRSEREMALSTLGWRKSTYSEEASSCVYVAAARDGAVLLRESDEPDVVLVTTRRTLRAFISRVKAGALDDVS